MPISSSRDPVPRPPTTRKNEIFNPVDYVELDRHVNQFDEKLLYGSTKELVNYLVQPTNSEVGRVRAIFMWLASVQVDFLPRQNQRPSVSSPYVCLQKIKEKKSTQSLYFYTLCREANIHCVKVKGIAKNARYEVGKELEPSRLKSQWNAVVIDGEWRFIDVLWCSQAEARASAVLPRGANRQNDPVAAKVNEFFFLTDPDKFIFTHFPDEPKLQLLTPKVSLEEFEGLPYLRERFFDMGLYLMDDSQKRVIVETENGKVFIQFGLEEGNHTKQFRYVLHPPKSIKDKLAIAKKFASGSKTLNFDDAVSRILHPGELRYHLSFPELGTYRFDIFGKDTSNTNLTVFDIVCSYIVDYKPDGFSSLQVKFFFKEPSEHARYLRRGGASDWLKKKEATLKVMGNEMILSIALLPGPNTTKYLIEDYESSNHLAPAILRSLMFIIPEEAKLWEAHDVANGRAKWKIENMFIVFLSHVNGLVRTADGKAKLRLQASKTIEVWYEFHEDSRTRGVPEGAVDLKVTHETDRAIFALFLNMPRPMNYLLTLFARLKGVDQKFYHLKTYQVQYETLDCV